MLSASVKKILVASVAVTIIGLGTYLLQYFSPSPRQLPTSADQTAAPDFLLSDLAGQKTRLSDYRGKVVLLDFWATWCDPCKEEIPSFVDLQSKYGNQGFQIIGISMDDEPEPVHDFYKRFQMNYPVLMGNAKIGDLYGGILGLPVTYLIGRDGRISAKHIGATEISILEKEIARLLQREPPAHNAL